MNRRLAQVNELLRMEIAKILSSDLSTTSTPFVTITRVNISPDFSHADVFIMPLNIGESGSALANIKKLLPRLRRSLASRVELRRTPQLRVLIDEGQLHAARIEELLHQVKLDSES